ncbi:MAG TPA: hypothetical protein VFV55_01255, partial [Usitatibacteraceae bacterium]|nr:hypothetical protein [Usitatibacteraceae bacterium]
AIRVSDKLTRREFERWMCRPREEGGRGFPKDVAQSRAILMQCLIEGLAVRALRDPDLDARTLKGALEPLFLLLGLAQDDPPARRIRAGTSGPSR